MPDDRRDRLWMVAAWGLWAGVLIAVCVMVARDPVGRSVTPVFRTAAGAWQAGKQMYTDGENGFLYLPQSAILYVPFTWGPIEVGEVLWRVVSVTIFATGLWRAVARLREKDTPRIHADERGSEGSDQSALIRVHPRLDSMLHGPGAAFLIATLLCLPLAESNARNGQHNLPLAGLMLHAAADLALSHWWMATLSLCLMTALKPLGIVMLLLAGVVYPATSWRMAIGLAGVATLPFIHPSTSYALDQYRGALSTMDSARKVEMPRGQDLRGIFTALGITVAPLVLTVIRAAAAPLMLGVAWIAKHRWNEPRGALYLLAAAAIYLSLFNPRTEGLTYVVLSPVIALFLLNVRTRVGALLLLIIGIAVAISQALTGGVNTWMRPSAAILLLGWILLDVAVRPARRREAAEVSSRG